MLHPATTIDVQAYTRIYSRRAREREGGEEGERAGYPLLSRWDMRPELPAVLPSRRNTRAILRSEYMTRSTRINWHYGYDVVSLATVTPPTAGPLDHRPRGASRGAPYPFSVFHTAMHNALAILPVAVRGKK